MLSQWRLQFLQIYSMTAMCFPKRLCQFTFPVAVTVGSWGLDNLFFNLLLSLDLVKRWWSQIWTEHYIKSLSFSNSCTSCFSSCVQTLWEAPSWALYFMDPWSSVGQGWDEYSQDLGSLLRLPYFLGTETEMRRNERHGLWASFPVWVRRASLCAVMGNADWMAQPTHFFVSGWFCS